MDAGLEADRDAIVELTLDVEKKTGPGLGSKRSADAHTRLAIYDRDLALGKPAGEEGSRRCSDRPVAALRQRRTEHKSESKEGDAHGDRKCNVGATQPNQNLSPEQTFPLSQLNRQLFQEFRQRFKSLSG